VAHAKVQALGRFATAAPRLMYLKRHDEEHAYPFGREDSAMMYGYGYGWSGMGFGPMHWLFFVIMVMIVVWPLGRILSRAGFSPLWSIVAFIPIVNLIALWLFAFADWPGSSETK
jgi:hypothetical protein